MRCPAVRVQRVEEVLAVVGFGDTTEGEAVADVGAVRPGVLETGAANAAGEEEGTNFAGGV